MRQWALACVSVADWWRRLAENLCHQWLCSRTTPAQPKPKQEPLQMKNKANLMQNALMEILHLERIKLCCYNWSGFCCKICSTLVQTCSSVIVLRRRREGGKRRSIVYCCSTYISGSEDSVMRAGTTLWATSVSFTPFTSSWSDWTEPAVMSHRWAGHLGQERATPAKDREEKKNKQNKKAKESRGKKEKKKQKKEE